MATKELAELLKQQIESQRQQQEEQRHQLEEQKKMQQDQMDIFMKTLQSLGANVKSEVQPLPNSISIPTFSAYDPSTELWSDYYSRFNTFIAAYSVPQTKIPQVFLTNQSTQIYKSLENMAKQQETPISMKQITIKNIEDFMSILFDPKRFVVRERFKFWNNMHRKSNETVNELATRIRQDAATCDFASITNPQDEAMCTRFLCSIQNEAVLFKVPADELNFAKAIQIAQETEEAAKVAKETVSKENEQIFAVQKKENKSKNKDQKLLKGKPCIRCGKQGHSPKICC